MQKNLLEEKFLELRSQRETWKLINGFMKKNNRSTNYCLEVNNQHVLDSKQVAGYFDNHFRESINVLFQGRGNTTPICYSDRVRNNFNFFPIRNAEIISIIRNLKDNNKNKAEIPVKILKLIAPLLAPILSAIFNKCTENSIFPDFLKLGHIIPIHKKGDKKLVDNYRPITILHPLAKIFEKLIYIRLMYFFNKFSIICNEQYGFRPGRSIQDAALKFQYDAYTANQKDLKLGAIFVDFKKAFDTVNHKILLHKLENYGVRGNSLELLESYLSNRGNSVLINLTFSKESPYNHGVPQGSALGPLLFSIFLNDITKIIEHCFITLYADDILIYTSCSNISNLEHILNIELKNIFKYSYKNDLFINFDKTKVMLFQKTGEQL